MGLADIVRGPQEEPPAAAPTELKGQVDETTGDIKLDTANLEVITARLKEVRDMMKPLKKEEDQLKKLILAHPDAKAGFSNAHVNITATDAFDLDSPDLLYALHKAKVLGEAMNMSLSIPKVRKIAERVKSVDKALKTLSGRKISTT